MAGKGIEINIAANTRDFQRGTKDVEQALEDVADSLDDVARDADRAAREMGDSLEDTGDDARKAGRKIGDELSDGAKDASKSVERVERSFKELADASKRETKQAGDSMRTNMQQGADGASEAVREWGDEAKANISETFSSFRGDAEDLVGIVQDTFGGVIGALGPVGMAAGAAGALGIGLMMGAFEDAKEREQEFREQVAELTELLIETGGEGSEAVQAIADKLRDLATETDKDAMSFEKLSNMAERASIDLGELTEAYVRGGGSLQSYIDMVDELAETENRRAAESNEGQRRRSQIVSGQAIQLRGVSAELREVAKAEKEAADNFAAWQESGGAALEARAEQMDALQGELDEAIGAWGDYYNAETGATDPAGYIAAMQARMDATSNFNTNVQQLSERFGLTFEETQAILDQGVDFAPMLQSIIDSGMGEQYAEQVRAMLDGGQAIVEGRPLNARVTTEADTEKVKGDLDAATAPRTAPVTTETDTSEVAAALDDVAGERAVTVTAKADTSDAAGALDKLAKQKRVATVTAKADTDTAQSALTRLASQRRTAQIAVRADTGDAERAIDRLHRLASEPVYVDVIERRTSSDRRRIDW